MLSEAVVSHERKEKKWPGVLPEAENGSVRIDSPGLDEQKLTGVAGTPKAIVPLVPDCISVGAWPCIPRTS